MGELEFMVFFQEYICDRNSCDIFPFTTESNSSVTEQKQKTPLREFLCPQSLQVAKLFWSLPLALQAAGSAAEMPAISVRPSRSLSTFHHHHFIRNQGNEINLTSQHQSVWKGNAEVLS